jgi:CheY-like chemotaxis protein
MVDILSILSDDKALDLLKKITLEGNCSSEELIRKTELTHKQYYSRLSSLLKVGLVSRYNRNYYLTSLGKVFCYLQIIAEKGLEHYWKLKAIDSFERDNELPKEKYQQFVDNLLDDQTIKEIITKNFSSSATMKNVLIQGALLTNYKEQRRQKKQKETFYKHNVNIMLVDDEPDMLLTYKTFLSSSEGYNVDTFTNSYAALRHFVSLNHPFYDLVVLDIRMPDLNGLQLYKKMRAIDESINVLFVSALDTLQEMVSVFPGLNLSNIIRKPVSKEEFLNKVKAVVAQAQN